MPMVPYLNCINFRVHLEIREYTFLPVFFFFEDYFGHSKSFAFPYENLEIAYRFLQKNLVIF